MTPVCRAALAAIACLSLAADRPKPKLTPLAEATARLAHGNTAEAEAALKPLLADAATHDQATILVARLRRETGKSDDARKLLSAAIDSNATAELLATRADLLHDMGFYLEARADANVALKKSPENLLAQYTLARLARDEGDIPTADAGFRAIVRYYSMRSNADREIKDARELMIVAGAGAENARWHQLPKQFAFILNEVVADALKNDPDYWPAEVTAGEMLLEKYNKPDAKDAFEKALRINPKSADALAAKAKLMLVQYQMKEADELADAALKINAWHRGALRIRADVALAAEDRVSAKRFLELARQANPREGATLGRLAAIAKLDSNNAELAALEATARGFDKAPGPFYVALADTLEERKRYTAAARYFTLAMKERPNLAESRVGLGMLRLRLGEEKVADEILNDALKADPFNIRVANTLKVLRHLDDYSTIETEHYSLRFDPSKDGILAKFLADYLEETHAELQKQYNGYEPPGKTKVELFNNHEMFSGRTIGLPDLGTIGACTGRVMCLASPTAKGVAKPYNWGRVVRHELTHIFNLNQTDFATPHWLTEGLAVRNEGGTRPLEWQTALRDHADQDTLFNLDSVLYGFVRPKERDERALAYAQSQIYVDYLVETHGPESVGKLLDAYRRGLDTATALREVCAVTKPEFEAGYTKYLSAIIKTLAPARPAPPKNRTVEELQAAVQADPDDDVAASLLAEALLKRDQSVEARKLVDRILGNDPNNALASLVKAQLLERAGDAVASAVVLERAMMKHPKDPKLIAALARVYQKDGEPAKAAELYEQGRKFAPLDGNWLQSLAGLYTQLEESEKLASVLEELAAGDPDDLSARVKLATVAFESKDYAASEKFAREAMRIDVNNLDAQDLLIDSLKARGKDAEAKAIAKRVAVD